MTCRSLATRAFRRCWAWLGKGVGARFLASAKRAMMEESIRSVFSRMPIASAYRRTLRGLVSAQLIPVSHSSTKARRSYPPLASITTSVTACSRQNLDSSAMPAASLSKLANRRPGSMQTSSLAFETSTPQIVFFTVTCLVHAIGTQATVRSCVTWRRSQSSPTVVAGGGNGRRRHALWPVATGQSASRFYRTNHGRADTRGLPPH